MMLFDPEEGPNIKGGNVAGRQGGGREKMIMRNNECYSETQKNWIWAMSPGETRKGSPCPRG
jgi:hypothetical protein